MNKTNQLKQLNFKVPEDFYWKLKTFASNKRLKMSEILEKAFNFYQKREQIISEINTYRQTIQFIENQIQTFKGKMSWEELNSKVSSLNSLPFNKIGLTITYEILKEVMEEYLKLSKKKMEENMRIKTFPNWSLN